MNRFEQTGIWQQTLAKQPEGDIHEKNRELLRAQFESFRERAKILAAEIARTMPAFTVHDVTHLDALWDTAEIVTKGDFPLTPTEAFVLGGAFLIHDLGMGLAAFPNGLEELKREHIWKDTITSLLKKKLGRQINAHDLISIDPQIEHTATETVLRLLHAKHAEKLATISWTNEKGESVFLIENTELREAYGSIIGRIAHSHWWPVDELTSKLSGILGAPGIFPNTWTVDSIKIACLLRIADATQIDDRRAPSFLRTIRKPTGVANDHWNFQQKLYQPRLEKDRLFYSSKSSFSKIETDSWWLCYDALQMIDEELKNVDSLLTDTNRHRLKAIGVASIEDPKRLSKIISVDGWQPVDTRIKVSDISKLVRALGGEQLYGDDALVPLRELIQNASDAIRARRSLEDAPESFGTIIVTFGQESNKHYIEIEDNGVGMSSKVLTGPFLDFGQSFWGSSLMHEELPGLESKQFTSTGRHGIGFFSVFMWSEKVTVISKRYDDSRQNTLALEFGNGTVSRPLLRPVDSSDYIKDGGTRIRVWVSESTMQKIRSSDSNGELSPAEIIGSLCPAIDTNISVRKDNDSPQIVINANDWLTLPPLELLKRISGEEAYDRVMAKNNDLAIMIANNIKIIKNELGEIIGRACIYKNLSGYNYRQSMFTNGVVTVGGFSTNMMSGAPGLFIGKSFRASRDTAIPIASNEIISDWATHQAEILHKQVSDPESQIELAKIVRCLGGNTSDLKIAHYGREAVSYDELVSAIRKAGKKDYFIVNESSVSTYERVKGAIIFYDNIILSEAGIPVVLQSRGFRSHAYATQQWPNISWDEKGLQRLAIKAIAEAFGMPVADLVVKEKKRKTVAIGQINGEEIEMGIVAKVKLKI